jgi:hypothetical protein
MDVTPEKQAKAAEVRQTGALDVANLSRTMQENLGDAEIQLRESRLLLNYISTVPKQSWPDMASAPKALVAAMREHPSQAEILKTICASLYWLNRHSGIDTLYMHNPETFHMIGRALLNHPDDVQLQCIVGRVMVDVLRDFPASLCQTASENGLLDTAFGFLSAHTEHVEAQYVGLRLLMTLARTARDTTDLVREKSISKALGAMRTHDQNLFIQFAGCEMLDLLLEQGAPAADGIFREGGLGTVIAAMNTTLLGNKSVITTPSIDKFNLSQTFDKDDQKNLVEKSIRVISALYELGTKPHAEADLNLVSRAMARYLQDLVVQQWGLRALFHAMKGCEDNVSHVGQQGMRAILAAMSTHLLPCTGCEGLQVFGLSCLTIMTMRTPSNKRQMIEDNGLRVVARSMHAFADSDYVTMDGIQAIRALGQAADPRLQYSMIRAGCCGLVAQAILSRSGAESLIDITQAACLCFRCILPLDLPNDVIDLLVHEKVVDAILQAMSEHKEDEQIQADGCYTLSNILLSHDDHVKTYAHRLMPTAIHAILAGEEDAKSVLSPCLIIRQIFHGCDDIDIERRILCQDTFAACKGVDAMIHCAKISCRQGDEDEQLAISVCCILHYCAYEHDENLRDMINKDVTHILMDMMVVFKDSKCVNALITQVCLSRMSTPNTHEASCCSAAPMPDFCAKTFVRNTTRKKQKKHEEDGSAQSAAHNSTCGSDLSNPVSVVEESEKRKDVVCAEVCVVCGKTPQEMRMKMLLKCSGCTIAPRYCSATCQKVDWAVHKAACKANRKK